MNPRRLLTSAAVLALLALPSSASAAGTLQPGAFMETDVGQCTLSFAFTGSGGTYFSTAAHCTEAANQVVRDMDGDRFGTVALRGDPDVNAEDYAFILVDTEDLARVSPQVKGSPQYPTGVTTPGLTSFGDTIQLSGFGLPFRPLALTRERRNALMGNDTETTYDIIGPALQGDSGGPVVHIRTGRALGIVSRLCIGVCTAEGPTVQGALAKARARGLTLSIRTA
ncbi:MAG: hypothetical protein H0T43_11805 [Solirubrobacterales bacterium]|nr:hypothetical protein [Solirubrobacterales bacterium]